MSTALGSRTWFIAAVAASVLLAGCDDKKQQAAAPAPKPAVGVRPAAMKGVSESFEFVGHIQAIYKVDLRARIEGFLEKVNFREGQEVKTGDLLYQIEKVQFQAAVDQAKANLAAAEAVVTNAQLQYNRNLELSKKQFSPQSLVDQQKADLDSGKAKVMQMQAALTQAEVNLSYTDIRSPIDGRIGRTAYQIGNLVNPASGVLATIVSQDPMYVIFAVSSRTAIALGKRAAEAAAGGGAVIKIRLPDGRMYGQTGALDFIDNTVAGNTDTITLRGRLGNPRLTEAKAGAVARELVDGEFVTVILEDVQPLEALTIPRAAVLADQSGEYVYVVDADNKAQQRRVQFRPASPSDIAVTSGLADGERVIVEGIQRVRPGQPVSPAPASPAAPAAAAPSRG